MEKVNPSKELDVISRGDPQVKKELITVFLNQTSIDIIKLNTYLKVSDWYSLKNLAHKMKSTFIYLNEPRALALAELLMSYAGDDIKVTKEQVKEFVKICRKVIRLLKQNLNP